MNLHRLTTDEVYAIADEVCQATGAHIRSYPALAAIAAVTAPRLAGVPMFRNVETQAHSVREACLALRPLSADAGDANALFAEVINDVLTELSQATGR